MPDPLPLACAACRERFPELLDDALPAASRRRTLEHLTECAGCRAALAAVERAGEMPGPGEAQPMDPRTREELLQLFRSWRAGRQGD